MTKTAREVLNERQPAYGGFEDQALLVQKIKSVFRDGHNWNELDAVKTEALEMIATKIGRVLNGDMNHLDSWLDISGYCQLVIDRLPKVKP